MLAGHQLLTDLETDEGVIVHVIQLRKNSATCSRMVFTGWTYSR